MGDNIQDPENKDEWLLSLGPLILKDVLVLLPLGSPIPTAALFSVNLTATVFLSVPITPVVNNKILLAVAAGVMVTSSPVFENPPEPVAVPVSRSSLRAL